MHDSGVLSGIMNGERYLSVARVASYEKHKKRFANFERCIEKYDIKEYFENVSK